MKRLEVAGRRGGADSAVAGAGLSGRISFRESGADRDESGALVTSAINRSLLAGAGVRGVALAGILVSEASRGRRRGLALVFRDEPEVIGVSAEPASSDEEPDEPADEDERAEPSEALTPEERAFLNLTKRNTDFNSINSNLSGASRTLVDWVDDDDRVTERSALTGRHKKFTPVVCVAPFSTGRGPGPLKVNPVAPMQNGEVVPTERRRPAAEMVEKRTPAERADRKEETVTRLDLKITRLDDPVTKLDEKVTKLDEKITPPDEVKTLDEKVTRVNEPSKSCKGSESKASEKSAKSDISSKTEPAKPPTESGQSWSAEDVEKPRPGGRPAMVGEVQLKPVSRRSAADRDGSAPAESDDVTGTEPAADRPMSNIDVIKQRLAAKAKEGESVLSWRGKNSRNHDKLNTLDGVPKSPKFKSHREKLDHESEETRKPESSRAKSPPRAFFAEPAADAQAPERDAIEKPEPAGGAGKNGENAAADPAREHLCVAEKSGTDVTTEAREAANRGGSNAGTEVKPDPETNKPSKVGDKPKLAAKPEKVRGLSHTLKAGGADRRQSLETAITPKPEPVAEKVTYGAKVDVRRGSKGLAEAEPESAPAMSSHQRLAEPVKPPSAARKNSDSEKPKDDPAESRLPKPSSSPPQSFPREAETKAQRAVKREKELERQREQLERRNREEKAAAERTEGGLSAPGHPGQGSEVETSNRHVRRDAPQPGGSPPTGAATAGSGLYSQINRSERRQHGSQDAGVPPHRGSQDAGLPSHLGSQDSGAPRHSLADAAPPAILRGKSAGGALSTDPASSDHRASSSTSDDEDDEPPPPAPLRTLSVSPRTRKRGSAAVSFAPGVEDHPRAGGVKPRSQSMPRPGQLDARAPRDEDARGGRAGERRSRRDEPRARARFSLKKLLKFGREEKRRDRDQVYGEFRTKPEIIHPIDRAGVGCVQVIGRTEEQRRRDEAELRRRRERLVQDGTLGYDGAAPRGSLPGPPRLPERHSVPAAPPGHPGSAHTAAPAQRTSPGLTPEGRPKPPPPPPPSSRQSCDLTGSRPAASPPGRPPPPQPHVPGRGRDGWGRPRDPTDTDYANLGATRAGLTPKKPGRALGSRPVSTEPAERRPAATPPPQAAEVAADGGLRRLQTDRDRLSLRQASGAPPASLPDSYDAATASGRQALRQLRDQMAGLGSVPVSLRPLQMAPLSLREFQVAPQSGLVVGPHVFVEALHGAGPVVLCLTRGLLGGPPLSVPALASFTDTAPEQLLDEVESGPGGSPDIATVHVFPCARVRPLSSVLGSLSPAALGEPSDAADSDRQVLLLLLQTLQQLRLLAARGRQTVNESLCQLVALCGPGGRPARLAAVLGAPPPAAPLSPCLAALAALLRLLAVPEPARRARDGRGVSSVPDGPHVTTFELLASLLQRDDAESLRRAAAVLAARLWAGGVVPAEAARWLCREQAAALGRDAAGEEADLERLMRLDFLAATEPEELRDALELISI